MASINKDIGAVSAYAIAVEHGYTGTEEQWATTLANASTNAKLAADKADEASGYASTTKGYKDEVSAMKSTVETKAAEVAQSETNVIALEASAKSAKEAAVSSANSASDSASTATTKAAEAKASADVATEKEASIVTKTDEQLARIPEVTGLMNDFVKVSDTEPTTEYNRIWVSSDGEQVELPTKAELDTVSTTVSEISKDLDGKQDTLTPGENITIDENNVISATGGSGGTAEDITYNASGSYSSGTVGEALRGNGRDIALLKMAAKGTLYTEATDEETAYTKAVPSNALSYASLDSISGNTITDETTGELKSGAVDKIIINGKNLFELSEPISGGTAWLNKVEIIDGRYVFSRSDGNSTPNQYLFVMPLYLPAGTYTFSFKDYNCTTVFKDGSITSEPTGALITSSSSGSSSYADRKKEATYTLEEGTQYYLSMGHVYNWKGVKSITIDGIQIEKASTVTDYVAHHDATTLVIPEEITSLAGYGITGNVIDFNHKTFTQFYEIVDETVTALTTPVQTDISEYLTDEFNIIDVEQNGSITFHSPEAENGIYIPVPSTITYEEKVEA